MAYAAQVFESSARQTRRIQRFTSAFDFTFSTSKP